MADLCGAKTRSHAGTCKNNAMPNGRCRMHGGKSPGVPKNTNSVIHGFYSNALTGEEKQLYERAEVGTLDDEIRIAKVKLHRFVRLSGSTQLSELIDGALEVIDKHGVDPKLGEFNRREVKAAAPDYADLIIRQLDVVRKLELARVQMALSPDKDDDDITRPDTFIKPDEPGPSAPIL